MILNHKMFCSQWKPFWEIPAMKNRLPHLKLKKSWNSPKSNNSRKGLKFLQEVAILNESLCILSIHGFNLMLRSYSEVNKRQAKIMLNNNSLSTCRG